MYYSFQDIAESSYAEFGRKLGSKDRQKRKHSLLKGALVGGGIGAAGMSTAYAVPYTRTNYLENIAEKNSGVMNKVLNSPKTKTGKIALGLGAGVAGTAGLGAAIQNYRNWRNKKRRY